MEKIVKYIYIILFLAILIVPVIFIETRENVVSTIDNRTLVETPNIEEDTFKEDVEAYLEDRIGFRDEMITGYEIINDAFAHELVHPTYMYGKNGYIFFHMHDNIEYSDFHKSFADMAYKIQAYCEQRGKHFYLIFDPEKISVYRRYLPRGVNYDNTWVNEFTSYLDELHVNYVDNTALLTEKSMTEQVFNVKNDAGHWNDLGCYYATNALLEKIHEDIPSVTPLTKDLFNIQMVNNHYLDLSHFVIDEKVPSFQLKEEYKNVTSNYAASIDINASFRHFHYYQNISDGSDSLPRTLVFQGSYYNSRPQYFISRTKDYIGVHNYGNVLNFNDFYNAFDPDLVILDVAEYVFSGSHFNYDKMVDFKLNPLLVDPAIDLDTQVKELINNGIEINDNIRLSKYSGSGVDRLFLSKKTTDVKNAYLYLNGKMVDLGIADNDVLYTFTPHFDITNDSNCTIFIVDNDGTLFYKNVPINEVVQINNTMYELSPGTTINEKGIITMETNIKQNIFSNAALQLHTPSGNYLETITEGSKGKIAGYYVHNQPTGNYKIRFKTNSTEFDEYVDFEALLVNGKTYFYQFCVESIGKKKAMYDSLIFSGYTGEKEKLDYSLEGSDGVIIGDDGSITMNNSREDNDFNKVVIYLLDKDKEYIKDITQLHSGFNEGFYIHNNKDGWYYIRLKGNTPKRDEDVDALIYLERGKEYFYNAIVDIVSPTTIHLSSYNLFKYNY